MKRRTYFSLEGIDTERLCKYLERKGYMRNESEREIVFEKGTTDWIEIYETAEIVIIPPNKGLENLLANYRQRKSTGGETK